MQKFLSIPVTSEPNALVAIEGIKTIDEATATATTTTVEYIDGTTTTITHAADTAFSVKTALNTAVENALKQPWQKVVFEVSLNVAVSAVANA